MSSHRKTPHVADVFIVETPNMLLFTVDTVSSALALKASLQRFMVQVLFLQLITQG